ncbi:MAG TPA: HAD-IIIA family hydrolase, partial [Jatrophihabitans sp.]|nr:HAD-IIIA family hydrolase [Jatrophihabitans sp.]
MSGAGSPQPAAADPGRVAVVIPTIGRPQLRVLLSALIQSVPADVPVLVVDDSAGGVLADSALLSEFGADLALQLLHSGSRGPAAARNVGWRAVAADWIAFLDDDVVVSPRWYHELCADLSGLPPQVHGSQAVIEVPLPLHRRPTDFERGTAGLAGARWITADLAYRRTALAAVNGFDERFPRAFREDSDLALRVEDAGGRLVLGARRTKHPVRPADWATSLRQQAGNADDALMWRLHGRDWRQRAAAHRGRLPGHLLTVALAALALTGRSRLRRLPLLGWLAAWLEFSLRRIAPGPRTPREVLGMLATSALIPPAAVGHRLAGEWRWRHVRPAAPAAVLFDRDDTLVRDVPYNGDPNAVEPMPGARAAVRRLRRAGVPTAVISNQSGVGRGLLREDQVAAVNDEIDRRLGPFHGWFVCPHTDADG